MSEENRIQRLQTSVTGDQIPSLEAGRRGSIGEKISVSPSPQTPTSQKTDSVERHTLPERLPPVSGKRRTYSPDKEFYSVKLSSWKRIVNYFRHNFWEAPTQKKMADLLSQHCRSESRQKEGLGRLSQDILLAIPEHERRNTSRENIISKNYAMLKDYLGEEVAAKLLRELAKADSSLGKEYVFTSADKSLGTIVNEDKLADPKRMKDLWLPTMGRALVNEFGARFVSSILTGVLNGSIKTPNEILATLGGELLVSKRSPLLDEFLKSCKEYCHEHNPSLSGGALEFEARKLMLNTLLSTIAETVIVYSEGISRAIGALEGESPQQIEASVAQKNQQLESSPALRELETIQEAQTSQIQISETAQAKPSLSDKMLDGLKELLQRSPNASIDEIHETILTGQSKPFAVNAMVMKRYDEIADLFSKIDGNDARAKALVSKLLNYELEAFRELTPDNRSEVAGKMGERLMNFWVPFLSQVSLGNLSQISQSQVENAARGCFSQCQKFADLLSPIAEELGFKNPIGELQQNVVNMLQIEAANTSDVGKKNVLNHLSLEFLHSLYRRS